MVTPQLAQTFHEGSTGDPHELHLTCSDCRFKPQYGHILNSDLIRLPQAGQGGSAETKLGTGTIIGCGAAVGLVSTRGSSQLVHLPLDVVEDFFLKFSIHYSAYSCTHPSQSKGERPHDC